MQHEEQILTPLEFRQHRAVSVSRQNAVADRSDPLSSKKISDNLQLVPKSHLEIPLKTGKQITEANPIPVGDSQYNKLQKLSSQQAVCPGRTTRTTTTTSTTSTTTTTTKYLFGQLLPFVLPQLDKDRAMQLQTQYEKLKKNEIAKHEFMLTMKDIVKDDMLKSAADKVKAQQEVQKPEIQVHTSTLKAHTGKGMGMPSEPQTPKLLHQKSSAQETKSNPSLPVSISKEENTSTPDMGCSVNNQLSLPMTSSLSAIARLKELYNARKKPLETPDPSPQPLSKRQKLSGLSALETPDPLLQPLSKKQKISGPSDEDQSIERLNDVTAVSGVNLREEEQRLLSGPKEDSQVSEASLRAVREEEEKLILQKAPLQRKLAEIMAKCGMKNVSKDVERCLSLGVEERMRAFLCNLIRFSKQRVDVEKQNRKVVITSDIHQHLMILNRRAKEELEKKEAEAEKQRKLSEPESNNGNDGKKEDEVRGKSRKVNKQEDDKMRTTAANFAARAAVGGDDLLSKWQLMAEQAQKRREGLLQGGGKPNMTFGRTTADGRGSDRGQALALDVSGAARKHGRNQGRATQQGVSRRISIRDVISVLERETQMSRSPLIYKLYNRIPSSPARGS